jgi:hypothetical protein
LFLGGFAGVAALFFMLSPTVIATDVCCGPGTENTRALISLGLGVLGGCLALWAFKIGIFLTGIVVCGGRIF